MFAPWFIWLVIGIIAIGLEIFVPGLVIIFFGIGAVGTALVSLLPFVASHLWIQGLCFLVLSILSLVCLRRLFGNIFQGTVFDSFARSPGDSPFAEVIEDISPSRDGRIRYKGTTWNARTLADEIPAGVSVKIVRLEGMTYIVEKI